MEKILREDVSNSRKQDQEKLMKTLVLAEKPSVGRRIFPGYGLVHKLKEQRLGTIMQ